MSSLNAIRAERLHAYLLQLPESADLPTMREIAIALNFNPSGGAYLVCCAFDTLSGSKRIQQVHGSRSIARGHRIVRLNNGRVLKTKGCPLEL